MVRRRDAVAAYLTDQAKVVGDLKLTRRCENAGDAVGLRLELTIRGAESGVDIPGEMAQVVEVADGRIQRIRVFMTWAEALEAAGLSE